MKLTDLAQRLEKEPTIFLIMKLQLPAIAPDLDVIISISVLKADTALHCSIVENKPFCHGSSCTLNPISSFHTPFTTVKIHQLAPFVLFATTIADTTPNIKKKHPTRSNHIKSSV